MKIEKIEVKRILDSRGEETIEVKIESGGIKGLASVPIGKSVGSYEAVCLDCNNIEKNLPSFFEEVKKLDFKSSKEFDEFLIKRAGKNKKDLGANFTLGLSISFARILAKKEGLELWEYLKKEYYKTPSENFNLMINIIGGGVHSFNNLDLQEYWLVTKNGFSKETLAQILSAINILENKLPRPLAWNEENALSTNFEDNFEPILYLKEFKNFDLGIDIAANQVKKEIDFFEFCRKLKELEVKYLEDPFKEDDFENFAKLRNEFGFKVIGDDLTATNIERLKIALDKGSLDGVIVKPNQIGTIYETFEFTNLAKGNNLFTIFSHRSGETNDHWIIDLGIAFNTEFFKIGPPIGGERVAKYNRIFEIKLD